MRFMAYCSAGRHPPMVSVLFCAVLGFLRVTAAELPSQQKISEAQSKTILSATAPATNSDEVKLVGADPEPMDHGTNVPGIQLDVQVVDSLTGKPVAGADLSAFFGMWRDTQRGRVTDVRGHF